MCVFHLQQFHVELYSLALNEMATRGGRLICQVPQSAQCKLQSGVHHT